MLTKISPAGLPRQFFKIRTQNTDIAIIKKVPFFKKTVKLRPLKKTPFYREILVGDDNIMAQVAPPG